MLQIDDSSELRREIDRRMEAGSAELAAAGIRELWRKHRNLANAGFVCSRFEKLRTELSFVSQRLAVLRSFTVEPIIPLLRAECFCAGIDLATHLGDFNAYSQEILDSGSSLYRFSANTTILAVRTPDIAPELWERYPDLSPEEVGQICDRVCSSLERCITVFRERCTSALIVHNLEQPVRTSAGILDAQTRLGQSDAIRQINRDLTRHATGQRGVYILDMEALIARHGRLGWQDERKYVTARLPIAGENLSQLAREWLRFLVPLSGKILKALVVDLDNTLWGGVVGEEGFAGITLGAEYPGAAYQALQRAMLDLMRRGILLAICSKNNPDDAMEVLEKHSEMLLRPQHFAASRINWNDKAQSLREIASELNIGVDSLAFLDDNPVEREQVRASLPEVTVIELPADPFLYAASVRECPGFERLSLSSEDQERTALYARERERAKGEESFQSKEDFFRFLEQKVEIAPLCSETLARVAQLTHKTNQFNLTTRRYSEQQLLAMSARAGWQVLCIRVRDRFGDQGLVGVSITRDEGRTCEIDTFLLSCRVIGRTVETALLSNLAKSASERGCGRLTGYFVPTKKNAPARTFYPQHGFELESEDSAGLRWALDLAKQQILFPDWIELILADEAHNPAISGANH
jgi:FkbH-like protein